MRVKISRLAASDIEEIWVYSVENWSLEQADRYYNLVMDEIEYIASHPASGKDYGEFRKGYRRERVGSHFIFYKLNVKRNEVEIIRILHQRMDIDARLSD